MTQQAFLIGIWKPGEARPRVKLLKGTSVGMVLPGEMAAQMVDWYGILGALKRAKMALLIWEMQPSRTPTSTFDNRSNWLSVVEILEQEVHK